MSWYKYPADLAQPCLWEKAKEAPKAVIGITSRHHSSNYTFQKICRLVRFLETVTHALWMVCDELVRQIEQDNNVVWLPESSREFKVNVHIKSIWSGNFYQSTLERRHCKNLLIKSKQSATMVQNLRFRTGQNGMLKIWFVKLCAMSTLLPKAFQSWSQWVRPQ